MLASPLFRRCVWHHPMAKPDLPPSLQMRHRVLLYMVWRMITYGGRIIVEGHFPPLFSPLLRKVHDCFFFFSISVFILLIFYFVLIYFIEVFVFNLVLQLQFLICFVFLFWSLFFWFWFFLLSISFFNQKFCCFFLFDPHSIDFLFILLKLLFNSI
jgi:hypothetical protein